MLSDFVPRYTRNSAGSYKNIVALRARYFCGHEAKNIQTVKGIPFEVLGLLPEQHCVAERP